MEEKKFKTLSEAKKDHVLMVLQESDGNKTLAAKRLDITTKTMYNLLQEYGLHTTKKRDGSKEG